jgi:isochorismate synthase
VSRLPRLGDDDDVVSADDLTFLRDALAEPLPADKDILSVILPAPYEAPEKFLRLVPRHMGFLWRSPGSADIAGGGCAAMIEAVGEDRFPRLGAAARALWPRILVRAHPGSHATPVLVGGAAFAPNVPEVEPWSEFASDAFSLPRWTYRRVAQKATVTLSLRRDQLGRPDVLAAYVQEAKALLTQLAFESPTSLIPRHDIARSAVHNISADDWASYIGNIHEAIRSGGFHKIVAARRCVVDLPGRLEATGFMARLFAAYPDTTHFAALRESSTFLGATPETLFKKQGLNVTTHALAGTTRVPDDWKVDGASPEALALSRSLKDLSEHALVVKRICDALMPFAKKIRYSSTPHARKVRNLIHLQTPISAEVRPEINAFQLVAALHPTPAVGGFPAVEAARWLRYNEPLERGWYTGVLGWVDANDDGEFAVAIRCGVLTPRRAYIYAGAGIVEASDANAEYNETAAKMTPLLRALGVVI